MNLFDISDKVALVTGGGGALGGSMAEYLLENGAIAIILHYKQKTVDETVKRMSAISKKVDGFVCDVTDQKSVEEVSNAIIDKYGRIDILINAAGGNMQGATIGPNQSFFDVDLNDYRKVVDLNLFGSVIPSIVFGREMVKNKKGVIVNISSVAADRALTRVAGYSSSKAAIDNFTKWLSVELAAKYGDGLRVNSITPGFFIGNQNRDLLLKNDGTYTDRGNTIIQNTPMKRFGKADELNGALHYLCSDASKFVTGITVTVDGGFSAFSGV
ncbi:SDR family NAD(P)-dependent oxidoreductase [Flavobacteriaceae bacterium SZ-1-7]|uniref:SDR family NAD(P)-dependent oxidoreductase n=1 Tax=Tamlana sedimenti TaxID=3134126 RepID=UPI0031266280